MTLIQVGVKNKDLESKHRCIDILPIVWEIGTPKNPNSTMIQILILKPTAPHYSPTMSTMTDRIILTQQTEYERCHLSLPDEAAPIAGIRFRGDYYSFFKVVSTENRANQLVDRLVSKGRRTVVTSIPKGYCIWIHEATAQIKGKSRATALATPPRSIRILKSDRDYRPCQILVPDLDKPLTGINYNEQLYSLLRIVRDETQATELAQKLERKGSSTVITISTYGYSVWVFEPEARSVERRG